jgi:hypothetical protein
MMMLFTASLSTQISGKLMQYANVSYTNTTFTYGDDV